MPTTTPPAPVHNDGVTSSQLIFVGVPLVDRKHGAGVDPAESEQNCSFG